MALCGPHDAGGSRWRGRAGVQLQPAVPAYLSCRRALLTDCWCVYLPLSKAVGFGVLSGGSTEAAVLGAVDYKLTFTKMYASEEERLAAVSECHTRSAERLLKVLLANGGEFARGLCCTHVLTRACGTEQAFSSSSGSTWPQCMSFPLPPTNGKETKAD